MSPLSLWYDSAGMEVGVYIISVLFLTYQYVSFCRVATLSLNNLDVFLVKALEGSSYQSKHTTCFTYFCTHMAFKIQLIVTGATFIAFHGTCCNKQGYLPF